MGWMVKGGANKKQVSIRMPENVQSSFLDKNQGKLILLKCGRFLMKSQTKRPQTNTSMFLNRWRSKVTKRDIQVNTQTSAKHKIFWHKTQHDYNISLPTYLDKLNTSINADEQIPSNGDVRI